MHYNESSEVVVIIVFFQFATKGTLEELWKFGWMTIRSIIMLLCHMQRTQIMESEFMKVN